MTNPPLLSEIISDDWFEFSHPGATDAANKQLYRQRKRGEDWLEIQKLNNETWETVKYLSLIKPNGKRVQDDN